MPLNWSDLNEEKENKKFEKGSQKKNLALCSKSEGIWITCAKCGGTNIEWSEYEKMIWCYDCKIDTKGTGGVFTGPIPIRTSGLLGMRFDRWDMKKKKVIKFGDVEWEKLK